MDFDLVGFNILYIFLCSVLQVTGYGFKWYFSFFAVLEDGTCNHPSFSDAFAVTNEESSTGAIE
jgi:hypothetical protein